MGERRANRRKQGLRGESRGLEEKSGVERKQDLKGESRG
jgi:hypothetical protein